MRKSTKRRGRPLWLILCALVAIPCAALALLWLVTLPDVSSLRSVNPTTTAWIWVPLSRISPYLRRAVVAAEDASFFTHEGFDWEGMKDAAIYDLEKGELKRGGSTITQQLAKNLYLSSERSLLRKAQEALITRSLEHELSKERILELYLNVAEWGTGVYGAEAASRHHFNKPARDLTEDEAAWLAAVLPSPRRYDPLRKTHALAKRYERVLHRMAQNSRHQIRMD
jgi:monofunctional biosynthetic peptidoglycan transglycosylase